MSLSEGDIEYRDFDLVIWSEDASHFAMVVDSPAGPTRRVPLPEMFKGRKLEDMRLILELAIRDPRFKRRGSTQEKAVRDFGREVFNAIFRESQEISSKFSSSIARINEQREPRQGLRLSVRPGTL